uniref:uncharacterized protein LOC120334083 n=1 Tax=Styela clava TaxID=7725 RepID=UPI00193A6F84|nr:uncharacterized protein LOC120334083 [Styela clava]
MLPIMKSCIVIFVLVLTAASWAMPDILQPVVDEIGEVLPAELDPNLPRGGSAVQSVARGASSNVGGSHTSTRTCPATWGDSKHPTCSTTVCTIKSCTAVIYSGYYCGLEFQLERPLSVRGESCGVENLSCGKKWWRPCLCKSKTCWFESKRNIKHSGKLYSVDVWIKRPCGCECRGKEKNKPNIRLPFGGFNFRIP